MNTSFSSAVIEKLEYYVYLLVHPVTNTVFYVGKGAGNRIFQHLDEAIHSPDVYDKLEIIRDIHASGQQVRCVIHRHGLTDKEAREVEASLIDFIGLEHLTNRIMGYETDDRGQMSIQEITERYDAPQAIITEKVILINIRKRFYRGMSQDELYESTRKSWKATPLRHNPQFAFAIYNGIIRQVYEIDRWYPSYEGQKRWMFDGRIALHKQEYIGQSVVKYLTLGAQNPVKYVNC